MYNLTLLHSYLKAFSCCWCYVSERLYSMEMTDLETVLLSLVFVILYSKNLIQKYRSTKVPYKFYIYRKKN